MYEFLGFSLALATLLALNAAASPVAAVCWRFMQRAASQWSSRSQAEILFILRISPPALALISVAFFLVPSYLSYEPYATSEVVSKKLAALAMISLVGVAFAVSRAFRSWFATRALRRKWLRTADRIALSGIDIPAFRIVHSFPIIAVVGTLKPRLFIAERVLQSLSAEELAAAIAHECGHLAARDNFKRALLRACRDLLLMVPCGRALDRAWAETAECAADEFAAQSSAATALNLASALVRIAKMVPPGASATLPLAAFLVGVDETRGVKARVRRLIEIASNDYRRVGEPPLTKALPAIIFCSFLVLGVIVASNAHVLVIVHSAVEHVVSLLS